MCAKKRNDFRQLKRSNFEVEKCKTQENLSKFLNNIAYKNVPSMRDCVIKIKFYVRPKLKLSLFALYRPTRKYPADSKDFIGKKVLFFFIGHDRSSYYFL